jgi:BASS family bile acid:Na+ symporter
MAVPLVVAMAVAPYLGRVADRARVVLGLIANVSLLVVLVLFVGLNVGPLWGVVGSGAGMLSAVFAALVFAAGYLLGGPKPEVNGAMGLAAAARNVAAALPAASDQSDPKVIVMLLVATLAGLVVLLFAGAFLRRRAPMPPGPQEPSSPTAPASAQQAPTGGDGIQSARR